MVRATPVLAYPLKVIRWFAQETYRKNPEARLEAERAIKVFYKDNEDNLERRGVTEALVKGAKHNDARNPDPKGDHWTVELLNEDGEFVTKRHIYPADKA